MILVTGGAGYIGSHCVLDLIKNGYNVVILDNLSNGRIETVEALKKFLGKGKVVNFVEADLRNIQEVSDVFKAYKFKAVIHFAAFSLVPESVTQPQKYWRNNVVGSLNLLDAMLKYDVKNLVFSSTCATYGEPKQVSINEAHPQNPVTPYGSTKLAIEHAIQDYSKAYNLNYIIFRYFNVFGASAEGIIGEWHEPETHLVPNIIKSALPESKSGWKPFELYGDDYDTPDGTCIRDYINIEDLVRAHRLAYEHLKGGKTSEIINLGTENGQSVKDIFKVCEKVLNKEIPLKVCPRRDGDPAKLVADAAKAKTILGWKAEKELEYSIKTAYEWEMTLSKLKEKLK